MITIKIGNRRLLKLADFLDQVPRKRFDYRRFVGDDWQGKQDLSCGTTACALGWACTIPGFKKAGLRLGHAANWEAAGPRFEGATNFVAGANFFGITEDESKILFLPVDNYQGRLGNNATAKQVAKHIRKFVKNRS